jgi:hypothetical protein
MSLIVLSAALALAENKTLTIRQVDLAFTDVTGPMILQDGFQWTWEPKGGLASAQGGMLDGERCITENGSMKYRCAAVYQQNLR